jgi:hypothetical protein
MNLHLSSITHPTRDTPAAGANAAIDRLEEEHENQTEIKMIGTPRQMLEGTADSPSLSPAPLNRAKNAHLTPKYQVIPILRPTDGSQFWPTDGPVIEVSPSHQIQSGLPSGGGGNGLVSAVDSEPAAI